MEKILNNFGYKIVEDSTSGDTNQMCLYYINNKDKSVRWFWPSHIRKPLFLKFYNVSNWKSFTFSFIVKLIFILKLQSLFFKKKVISYIKQENADSNFEIESNWAVFTGTTGPNNKPIIYVETNTGNTFIKVTLSEKSKQLAKKEAWVLDRLFYSNIQYFNFPDVINKESNYLKLSDISTKGKRTSKITNNHINTLIELNEISSIETSLSELENWKITKEQISNLKLSDDTRLPKGLIRKLDLILNSINENEKIEVCFSHGDFTPWNMFSEKNHLNIYDWELADPMKPLGFDLFHFIIQQGILVDRKNWSEIRLSISETTCSKSFLQLSKFNKTDIDKYLNLYFIYNSAYYLNLYSQQNVWHEQVYWFFNVWNDALSSLNTTILNNREFILMDLFDFLNNKTYAAMKFPNMLPERLSKFSDVDLVVNRQTKKQTINYIKNHPLVAKTKTQYKSFMSNTEVFLIDGEFLSLDLINRAKRKELEIQNTVNILKNSYKNAYGVKMMDVKDNARFIGLFYALNGTIVPEKYQYYEEILSHSNEKIDKHIYPFFLEEKCNNRNIVNYVKSQKCNKGLKGLLNKLNYILDTLKSSITNKGTIITFSGVDGAGKSTVIENTKFIVEKQLRRRVVVLRHRPSLLPILSAWTKGKEKAEQDAAKNFPRQGKNKSRISSLIRFIYYLTDYIFGQFYIQLKYVSRGYVVLYDRYYFDFINDSKRSNIILPKTLLNLGFKLIIKPKYNFFLYADSKTILNRKKELSKETIETLTSEYLKQFEKLDFKSKNARYVSIENNNLDETVSRVVDIINRRAA